MANAKETRLEPSGNAEDIGQKQKIRRPYTFHVGASWAAKPFALWPRCPHPFDTVLGSWREHMLTSTRKSAGSSNQKPEGDPGDDFFFIQQAINKSSYIPYTDANSFLYPPLTQMRNQSGISFGVADGVGGCAINGVDPSLFSQALMYYAHQYSRYAWAGEPEIDPTMDYEEREQIEGEEMTPYECLDLAYESVLRDKHVESGASTACIISLNASSGVLRSANLGDSGYSIIRSNSIFYTSPPQTHYFNCPLQLSAVERGCSPDLPSMADTHEVKLRDGDIVVVYTDGLSDNVFPSEMITTLCSSIAQAGETEDERVQNMANYLVDYAQRCMSSTRATPFEREAVKLGRFYHGGKVDDITVIVGLVRETS